MKQTHFIVFDILESRQLQSTVHLPMAHPARVLAAPLVLDGTLSVNTKSNAISPTMNPDGSSTMSVAVAGQLGALGPVHGVWYENQDSFGKLPGTRHAAAPRREGNDHNRVQQCEPVTRHAKVRGAVNYEHTQRFYSGTGAYARASESGTIELTTNAAQTHVVSMTLHTTHP